jgi:hypothetical protein
LHKKLRRPKGYGKRRSVEKSKNQDFPTELGNPANGAGFPLFPQPRRLLDVYQTEWGKITVVDEKE